MNWACRLRRKKILKRRQRSYYLSLVSEYVIILWLRIKGYRILMHRYKTHVGEIDIIAMDGRYVVFIEVKFRKNLTDAQFCLKDSQVLRIENTSQVFLASYPQFFQNPIRYDLCVISFFSFRHIHNAWQNKNFAS